MDHYAGIDVSLEQSSVCVVLVTRVPKWSGLKAWGAKLTKRNGLRKAKVAIGKALPTRSRPHMHS
jgi:hypothetical protein